MSKSKIITYDLCKPDKNYDELYKYIKSLGSWVRVTESVWIVLSESSCEEIRNRINKITDSDDRVFVGELNGVAAWRNTICKSESLKERL